MVKKNKIASLRANALNIMPYVKVVLNENITLFYLSLYEDNESDESRFELSLIKYIPKITLPQPLHTLNERLQLDIDELNCRYFNGYYQQCFWLTSLDRINLYREFAILILEGKLFVDKIQLEIDRDQIIIVEMRERGETVKWTDYLRGDGIKAILFVKTLFSSQAKSSKPILKLEPRIHVAYGA